MPLVIEEFSRERDFAARETLLRVIAEFRLAETVPFFAERLFDAHWMAALDFLVTQASPGAVIVLDPAVSISRARQTNFVHGSKKRLLKQSSRNAREQSTAASDQPTQPTARAYVSFMC